MEGADAGDGTEEKTIQTGGESLERNVRKRKDPRRLLTPRLTIRSWFKDSKICLSRRVQI